jgi:hypothetical protein
MEREWERVWTKVWLVAGPRSDLREPGDFFYLRGRPGNLPGHDGRRPFDTRLLQCLPASGGGDPDAFVALVRDRKYRIVFGIVTRKDPAGRSLNLPLFSRISLMRGMKAPQLMDVPGSVIFIADQVMAAEGQKKMEKRKTRLMRCNW